MRVRKAVFPAAGWGTRFLPATKAQPKEMLPLVDKPVIQYAVEEAVAAGIEQVIIVTSSQKRAIEDHFDLNYELEHLLEEKGEIEKLRQVRRISDLAQIAYVRQKEQLGLGHAILMAKDVIGHEPFAVLLPDDVVIADRPAIGQLIHAYEQTQRGAGGEIQLTDAIEALMDEQSVYTYKFEGTRYDAGTTMGWLMATVDIALQRSDLGPELREHLRTLDL